MAVDVNSVTLIGRLTRDAESKSIGSNTLCTFSIAVNRRAKDSNDNWSDEAQFFDVELWGRQAEAISGFLQKGKQVAVQGSLRQSRWEQEGQKRSKVSITAQNVQLLGSSSSSGTYSNNSENNQGSKASAQSASYSAPQNASSPDSFEDDIPF